MKQTTSLTSAVLFTVVPKVANGVLTLLLGLALVVAFPVEQYGYYAYAITIILLADAIIGTPFDLAVIAMAQPIIKTEPSRAISIERQAFCMKLVFVTFVILTALAMLRLIDIKLVTDDDPLALLLVTGGAMTGLLVIRSLLLHLQMREAFGIYGKVEVLHVALKMIPAFVLIFFGVATPLNILLCFFLAPLLAAAVALFYIRFDASSAPTAFSYMPSLARSLMWYLPTLALGATLARLDIVLMGVLLPAAALGTYGAAVTLASVPDMIGMYLGIVLTPRVVKYAGQGNLGPFFRKTQLLLMALAVICYVVLFAVSKLNIEDYLPEKFSAILPVFYILIPGTLFAMTTSAMALPFVLLSKKRFLLTVDLCVAPFAAAAYFWVIPRYGIVGTAYLTMAVMLVRSTAVLTAALMTCDRKISFESTKPPEYVRQVGA